ncbi:MAG: HAD family hydrolase [Gammaproteobacteria bacterium]
MTLQLLCFDLDNTLWPVEPVIARAEEESWRWLAQQVPEIAAQLDAEALRLRRLALYQARPEYIHNLTALRRDALRAAFVDAGMHEPEARLLAEGALAEFLAHRNRVEFFPGAREALESLAGRYRLAALSNGNADLARIGLDHLFDVVLSAEKVGRAKPDPAMFLRALRDTGTRADAALHIGDHPEQDVAAAREQGLRPVWANLLQLPRPPALPDDVPAFEYFHELEKLVDRLHHGGDDAGR